MNLNNNNIKTNDGNKGIVIAELIKKDKKMTKNEVPFYILNISIKQALTDRCFEIAEKDKLTLKKTSHDPLYVFTNEGKNKYAYTLVDGYLYAFWFVKSYNSETKETYFHVKKWMTLSPNSKYIERSVQLIRNLKSDNGDDDRNEEYEELMTNKELLIELNKRIKEKKIVLEKKLVNSDDNPMEVDIDLKDSESKFRISVNETSEEK